MIKNRWISFFRVFALFVFIALGHLIALITMEVEVEMAAHHHWMELMEMKRRSRS
jgi:hypothetical protein